jgi:hypothetical protein
MLKKHSVVQHHLHLIKGEASAVIPELVKDLEIDLLVIGEWTQSIAYASTAPVRC